MVTMNLTARRTVRVIAVILPALLLVVAESLFFWWLLPDYYGTIPAMIVSVLIGISCGPFISNALEK